MLQESSSPLQRGTDDHAEDQQMVALLLSNDAAAWSRFVGLFGRMIRSRVADVANSFGYGLHSAVIDDATAEVFGAILANDSAALRAYQGRSSLMTYLAVIATRCSTRTMARLRFTTKRETQMGVDSHETCTSSDRDSPSFQFLQAEQRDQLWQVLNQLPEKHREIIRLYYLDGENYAQISQKLRMPMGSVGVTLKRAECKLREKWDQLVTRNKT